MNFLVDLLELLESRWPTCGHQNHNIHLRHDKAPGLMLSIHRSKDTPTIYLDPSDFDLPAREVLDVIVQLIDQADAERAKAKEAT